MKNSKIDSSKELELAIEGFIGAFLYKFMAMQKAKFPGDYMKNIAKLRRATALCIIDEINARN